MSVLRDQVDELAVTLVGLEEDLNEKVSTFNESVRADKQKISVVKKSIKSLENYATKLGDL